ncbi:hypothetical protein EV426DRAFT_676664 [Tirmania nivea]|nr:hypothetical protein EV426DRAFT_676664 [Tirmania nivea]
MPPAEPLTDGISSARPSRLVLIILFLKHLKQKNPPTYFSIKTTMSTPVVKRQNTISGFKSRIPVACGLHGPASNKPFINAALGELTGGTKSKIPVPKNQMKNTKRQTLSSVAHSNAGQIILTGTGDPEIQTAGTTVVDSKIPHYSIKQSRALNTESQTALLEERIKGIKTSIQSPPLFYKTKVSNTMKPHLNEDARPTTRVIVTSTQSPEIAVNRTQKTERPTGTSKSSRKLKSEPETESSIA